MAPFAGSLTRLAPLAIVCGLTAGCAAVLTGCDEKTSSDVATAKIGGKTFHLEIVADPAKRTLGLGKRTVDLEEDGGMIFVFPAAQPESFVMRDCKFTIDILFLDGTGRILAMHSMPAEAPRSAEEGEDNPAGDAAYNARLTKYPSRYPSQFVVEIKGGKIKELGLKETDKVTADFDGLKKLAR